MNGNRTKRAKVIARKLVDLSEFDITRYDACAELDATGWACCLHLRYMTRGVLLGPELRAAAEEKGELDRGFTLLLQYLDRPVPSKGMRKPLWSPFKYRSVSDIDIYTIWGGRELFEKLPEATEACSQLDQMIAGPESNYEAPPLTHMSFHSHVLEKTILDWHHTEPRVFVNLRATDEQIKAQFAGWLQSKRKELASHGIAPDIPAKFTPATFNSWHKNRVLGFIDLEMFAYHLGLTLTDEMIGSRLFPNELDLGIGDKVRKTVRPLAKWLMTSETIDALDWQSGYDYYSKRGHAEESE
jgi:hypothetical protein